jgi:hypothetical protein
MNVVAVRPQSGQIFLDHRLPTVVILPWREGEPLKRKISCGLPAVKVL